MGEYEETKQQLFEDNDVEYTETIENFEKLLEEEKKIGIRLKGENAVIKRKFYALQAEIEAMMEKAKEIVVFEGDRKAHMDDQRDEIELFDLEMKRLDTILGEKEVRISELKKVHTR